jgi:hypothetical protein
MSWFGHLRKSVAPAGSLTGGFLLRREARQGWVRLPALLEVSHVPSARS